MTDLWNEPWFPWAVGLAVGVPVLLIVLTELLGALSRRASAAVKPIRLLRNYVVPVGAILALLILVTANSTDLTWVRIVGTLFGFLVILLVLSAFNVALFATARDGSWRQRIPTIFVELARLALILTGLVILFSWVWKADIGGLVAALGVTSIVVGLALQNAVGSVISGLLLLFEQPFKLGDWIATGTVRGRVVEVNWRAVHLDTGDGIQVVPNAALAGSSFTNLSQPVGDYVAIFEVAFASDDPPDDVLRLLHDVAAELPFLSPGHSADIHYTGAGSFAVALPVPGPSAATTALALYRGWLWYASRRRGLALDGNDNDPMTTPERLQAAVSTLAPALHAHEDDYARITRTSTLEHYGTGETIQQHSTIASSVRFIVSGRAQRHTDGSYSPGFMTLDAGDCVGDSALTREPEDFATVAASPVIALRVDRPTIDWLIQAAPRLAEDIGSIRDRSRRALQQQSPDHPLATEPAS
ncbi:mechanosensitive ion channel domain-containing protein [Plantibacter sp. RU18]|uniref:mechanosensitive ion channel domain-containing protein n=1 Tax=Plantibacter sp. RU18 TaxID=3158143 RepID=UPI003D36EFE4